MKIKIGPYINWIGPYQIAEKILFWKDKYDDDIVHDFGTWLAEDKKGNPSMLMKICTFIHNMRERTVKIHIDKYDTWNMESTLSMIILPMLKQLKSTTHGAPLVADSDVPVGMNLRSTEAKPKENEYDVDENHFKRWDYVLDELIWTFEQLHPDNDWESQYHSGENDLIWEPCGDDGQMHELKYGPNHTFKIDKVGLKKHEKRIQNGLRLFGKYYRNLWD